MTKIGSFTLQRKQEIEELCCTLVELVHEPSGATVMQIANDDPENLFNISFRTTPMSSNGVAHILEHTVLCGSKKFPVKDPFFSMNRRSLATFMNAFTGADFTCYPASSCVPKDFYNLLSVYADAVFHPLLDERSFLQEGHRLEFDGEDLRFKGIVFNEMKGAMASGDARLQEALMQAIYPNLTYGINSGGEPKEILKLSYSELLEFHATFYHPSRALFFFYGNLPLEGHLEFLEKEVLTNVERKKPLAPIPPQPRFASPSQSQKSYPASKEEKTLVGMGWLTCSILDQEELLALSLLDLLLSATDASPLKMALLKSDLCKQADVYLDTEMSEAPFAVICKGCEKNVSAKLERVVRSCLEELCESGFSKEIVAAGLHQLQLARMEITGNSSPYGLSLFFRAALLWQHGGDPESALRIHTLFHQLETRAQDPAYLPGLIRKHLLHNPHFVRVEMQPDLDLGAKEEEEENKQLASLEKKLSTEMKAKIQRETEGLEQFQEEEEDLDVLPKVHLEDVPQRGLEYPLSKEQRGPITLYQHETFTNDLVYAELVFDLPRIEEEELADLRLFTQLLTQMGCAGRTYQEQLDYLMLHTGGVGAALDLNVSATHPSQMRPSFSLRGKALHQKQGRLFSIFRELLCSVNFEDPARVEELMMQIEHGLETSLQNSSIRYALSLAASGQSLPSMLHSKWYGLDYYYAIKKMKKIDAVIAKMKELQERLLGLARADLVITGKGTFDNLQGLEEVLKKEPAAWHADYELPSISSHGRITASPVAFTAEVRGGVYFRDPLAASLCVASEIMSNKVLHKKIREQGGAYGSGASANLSSGLFSFYGYRDPHIRSTQEAFGEAIEMLARGDFDEEAIEEAKLGIFQDLDSPIAPGSRGAVGYFRLRCKKTPELRQSYREALLSADKKSIQNACALLQKNEGTLVTFAGKELLDKEKIQPQLEL